MWKTADKVKIVYSASKYTYKGSKYPQAYVVTNKSQLDTAIRWAGSSIYDPVAKKYISVTPKIIETDNKGFTLTLGYAPGGACCGGKLSFCITSDCFVTQFFGWVFAGSPLILGHSRYHCHKLTEEVRNITTIG